MNDVRDYCTGFDGIRNKRSGCQTVCELPIKYRVFLKKVLHKRKGKMQEKMKMTLQKNENVAQVQPQHSVYFCIKIIFKS